MDGRGVGVRFSRGTRDLHLLHIVQTDSGAHPASYPIYTREFSTSRLTLGPTQPPIRYILESFHRPAWLWGPLSLLSDIYWRVFIVQTDSGAHPASYPIYIESFHRPDWLWGPPRLLYDIYWRVFIVQTDSGVHPDSYARYTREFSSSRQTLGSTQPPIRYILESCHRRVCLWGPHSLQSVIY
jgi:hypothetical protein